MSVETSALVSRGVVIDGVWMRMLASEGLARLDGTGGVGLGVLGGWSTSVVAVWREASRGRSRGGLRMLRAGGRGRR